MDMNIENLDHRLLLEHALDDFSESSCNPFEGLQKISTLEKIINEREARKITEKTLKRIEPFRTKSLDKLSASEKEELKQNFMELAEELDRRKIFFSEPFLTYFMTHGYLESTEAFLDLARGHDEGLLFSDLFQAVRNVWIMNSLQLLFDEEIRMTPSIFGYSMLYPYTDNFLDDPRKTHKEKKRFNDRLQMVLEGAVPEAVSPEEDKVFDMIRRIETQYPRQDFPEVYRSLLMIQDAQVTSLSQGTSTRLSPSIILPISFYKGGTSVLADAFLCKGVLKEPEMDFAFGYGAFLQLLDDFQDIDEDRKNDHWTLFSVKNQEEIFDNEVCKLLCYINRVLEKHHFGTPKEKMIKGIIRECTRIMVMNVVGRSPHLVSERLYRHLESFSTVRLSFYREYGNRISERMSDFDLSTRIGSL